jgi:tRNA isopentenyl-2-thiomethyl-A-37 hydroxylase MiaE
LIEKYRERIKRKPEWKKFLQFETYARIIDSYGERTDIESSMQIFNAAEAALLIKLKA